MGVEKQVFASNAERRYFYKLSRQWGDKFRIYHNLPFLNIFNTKSLIDFSEGDSIKKLEINDIEYNRLKKTSIDFTLCGNNDEPLICIDFDGYQQGYNVGSKYHPTISYDGWKETIYNLKLKVAQGSLFPYFVLSSKQFDDLASSLQA